MVKFISDIVVRFPRFILVLALIVTSVAGYFGATGVSLKVVLEDMLPANHPNVDLYKEFSDQFGGVNNVLIEVRSTSGDIYNSDFLEIYREISDEIYF